MTKTQWHTEPPEGEHRPVWVTYKNGLVNWNSAISTAWDLSSGNALAWTEYTAEKPEPYQPPSQPTAEEIEAWRELEEFLRGFPSGWWPSSGKICKALIKLEVAREKK